MPTQKTNSYEQLNDLSGGWIPITFTLLIGGNSTLLATSNLTGTFPKGTKVWWNDSGIGNKYGVIGSTTFTSGSVTTFNLIPTTDFIASGVISLSFLSYQSTPVGFPTSFNYAVAWQSASNPQPSLSNGTLYGKWIPVGTGIFTKVRLSPGTGTSYGTGAWQWTIPISSVDQASNVAVESAAGNLLNGGTRYALSAFVRTNDMRGIYANSILQQGTPVTLVNGDVINLSCFYEY